MTRIVSLFRCVDCGRPMLVEGICRVCRERTGRQLELFPRAA